jgi:hypothetical protein
MLPKQRKKGDGAEMGPSGKEPVGSAENICSAVAFKKCGALFVTDFYMYAVTDIRIFLRVSVFE